MNRRTLLKYLLTTPLALTTDFEKLLWVPKPIVVVPSLPLSLYGIPYHQSNGSVGSWLGICRTPEITNDLIKMVSILENDKKEYGWTGFSKDVADLSRLKSNIQETLTLESKL